MGNSSYRPREFKFPEYTERVFKIIKHGMIKEYSPELLANMPELAMESWASLEGRLLIRMAIQTLYEPVTAIKVSYPKTWWDAFKKRWYPRWALKRWPVEFETQTMEARAVYPLMPLPPPNQDSVLHLSIMHYEGE